MLVCKLAGYSARQIGQFFSRDHTTVLHAIEQAKLFRKMGAE